MNNEIDLDYISASSLMQILCSEYLTIENVVNFLEIKITDDISLAEAYIKKYDNKWDRAEGVDVTPLKESLKQLQINLEKLKKGELK